MVSGLMSSWKSVKISVPQVSIQRPVLFDTINYIDSGADGRFNNFTGDTKLSGKVYVLQRRDAIERELCRLEEQAHANFMKF